MQVNGNERYVFLADLKDTGLLKKGFKLGIISIAFAQKIEIFDAYNFYIKKYPKMEAYMQVAAQFNRSVKHVRDVVAYFTI